MQLNAGLTLKILKKILCHAQAKLKAMLHQFVAKQKTSIKRKQPLSQRLRGIAVAPKDFDYKEELANRFEA